MRNSGAEFIETYIKWIKKNSAERIIDGYTEITTPFLDPHNDAIQFYVRREGEVFVFTDDGYTINDLEMNGVKLSAGKRKQLISDMANMMNVQIEGNEIKAVAPAPTLVPQTMHTMLQAILKFSDMLYSVSPRIKSLFFEDVKDFFSDNEIRFSSSPMYAGQSGLPQRFDFVIPGFKQQPERMVTVINQPSKQSVQSAIFSWDDVRRIRKDESEGVLILNDKQKRNLSLAEAAKNRGMHAYWWSDRETFKEQLIC